MCIRDRYGGVYVGAMYSLAFISNDIQYIVEEALKTIPIESTFYQCISEDVYKRQAQLLKDGENRVNEICYMVGFNSPSYFSKCFLKQFGVLPKDFVD